MVTKTAARPSPRSSHSHSNSHNHKSSFFPLSPAPRVSASVGQPLPQGQVHRYGHQAYSSQEDDPQAQTTLASSSNPQNLLEILMLAPRVIGLLRPPPLYR